MKWQALVPDFHRIGWSRPGKRGEILNTDEAAYGGAHRGNAGAVVAHRAAWNGQTASASLILAPLAPVWRLPDERG